MDIGGIRSYIDNVENKLLSGEEITDDDRQFSYMNNSTIEKYEDLMKSIANLKLLNQKNKQKRLKEQYFPMKEKAVADKKQNLIIVLGASGVGKTVTSETLTSMLDGKFYDTDWDLPWLDGKTSMQEFFSIHTMEDFDEIYTDSLTKAITKGLVTEKVQNMVVCGSMKSPKQYKMLFEKLEANGVNLDDISTHTFTLDCNSALHQKRTFDRAIASGETEEQANKRVSVVEKDKEEVKRVGEEIGSKTIDTTNKDITSVAEELLTTIIQEKQIGKGVIKKKNSPENPIDKVADASKIKSNSLQQTEPKTSEKAD